MIMFIKGSVYHRVELNCYFKKRTEWTNSWRKSTMRETAKTRYEPSFKIPLFSFLQGGSLFRGSLLPSPKKSNCSKCWHRNFFLLKSCFFEHKKSSGRVLFYGKRGIHCSSVPSYSRLCIQMKPTPWSLPIYPAATKCFIRIRLGGDVNVFEVLEFKKLFIGVFSLVSFLLVLKVYIRYWGERILLCVCKMSTPSSCFRYY